MPSHDFRCVHLSYCIKRLPDGRHVVLNRDYKPLGFKTQEHVEYESYPIAVKLKGLTGRVAAKLSWAKSENTDDIFLYNDQCIPTHSVKNMNDYLERLSILSKTLNCA